MSGRWAHCASLLLGDDSLSWPGEHLAEDWHISVYDTNLYSTSGGCWTELEFGFGDCGGCHFQKLPGHAGSIITPPQPV